MSNFIIKEKKTLTIDRSFQIFSFGIIYTSHHPGATNISRSGLFIPRTTRERLTFSYCCILSNAIVIYYILCTKSMLCHKIGKFSFALIGCVFLLDLFLIFNPKKV